MNLVAILPRFPQVGFFLWRARPHGKTSTAAASERRARDRPGKLFVSGPCA